ncbi:MAG: hypothetical protein SRB2_04544 [Desulfobacteraceae bacterium Eth-SRB2]|nr:MAG: hypothetical protein SRB2_04544 [Desulfobacteraceae bacterium Eth-SRB2]
MKSLIIKIIKKIFFLIVILIIFYPITIKGDDATQPKHPGNQSEIAAKNQTNSKSESKTHKESPVNSNIRQNKFDYGPIINFFGIIISVFISSLLIVWQLGRQHKNNIELEKENNREKLKLEIYSEYRKKISEASNKTVSLGAKARTIVSNLNLWSIRISKGMPHLPISDREKIFNDAHNAAIYSITDVLRILEEFEIINPNLKIFRTALNCAIHEMFKTFRPFHLILLKFLPYNIPPEDQEKMGTDVIIPGTPTEKDLQEISAVAEPYIDAVMETSCYIGDLMREAQNIFLGSLFTHRIPLRQPIDSCHIVISTLPKEVEKLEKYFYEETDWGKNAKRLEEKLKEEVKKGFGNSEHRT